MDREIGLRKRLVAQRTRLLARKRAIGRDLRAVRAPAFAEAAAEGENEAVLQEIDATSRADLARIERALRRMEAGTYGLCEECGGAIDALRLEALPATPRCASCATVLAGR